MAIMNARETARFLGVPERTLLNWIKSGLLIVPGGGGHRREYSFGFDEALRAKIIQLMKSLGAENARVRAAAAELQFRSIAPWDGLLLVSTSAIVKLPDMRSAVWANPMHARLLPLKVFHDAFYGLGQGGTADRVGEMIASLVRRLDRFIDKHAGEFAAAVGKANAKKLMEAFEQFKAKCQAPGRRIEFDYLVLQGNELMAQLESYGLLERPKPTAGATATGHTMQQGSELAGKEELRRAGQELLGWFERETPAERRVNKQNGRE